MAEDKKTGEKGKVESKKNKQKNRFEMTTSNVTALIISFLGFVTIIYDVFSINLGFMNPIMELINDANGFMTFICVSFIVYESTHGALNLKSIIAHLTGIVLVNRLYSNSTWLAFFDFLKELDGRHIAFAIAITVAILYLCFKMRGLFKYKKDELTGTITTQNNPNNQKKIDQTNSSESSGQNKSNIVNKQHSSQKPNSNNLSVITVSISVLFAVVAFFFLDDYFVNKSSIEVIRPSLFSAVINYGYIGFVVVPTLLILLGMLFYFSKRKKRSKPSVSRNVVDSTNEKGKKVENDKKSDDNEDGANNDESIFSITAVVAIILEVALFTMANKSELNDLNNKFVAYITDDVFSFVIYGTLLFLLLQLGLIVFLGLFTHYGLDNSIAKSLRNHIQDIQKRIVDIACGLLIGCLSLFRFIPDFFDTIGVLLLGEDSEKKDKDKLK